MPPRPRALSRSKKTQLHQTTPMKALAALKRFDFFGFTPMPVHKSGVTVSSWGFLATFLCFGIVIAYAVVSITRFVYQDPSVSVVQGTGRQSSPLFPFWISLANPEQARVPLSRRPQLTIDESYLTITAKVTSAATVGLESRNNTFPVPFSTCETEMDYMRRNSTHEAPYCPSRPDGVCPATRICFNPVTMPAGGSRISDDCDLSASCQRLEIAINTCAEPAPPSTTRLTFVAYNYSVPISAALPASTWEYRLKNFTSDASTRSGLLQIRANASWPWGIICNDGFDQMEVEVMCRTMGLPWRNARQLSSTSGLFPIAQPPTKYYVDNTKCVIDGTNFVDDCGFLFYPPEVTDNDCVLSEGVGIYCGDTPPYRFEFALVNGSSPYIGLVVTRPIGTTTWATVQRDNISTVDAMAICRAMGYNVTAARILPQGTYGAGAAFRYYMTNPRCTTQSADINDCADILYADFKSKNLNEEIAIDCSFIYEPSAFDVMLVDPSTGADSTTTGIGVVQVRPKNVAGAPWGAVCSFDFNGLAAGAFCRAMGFPSTTARAIRREWIESGNNNLKSFSNVYIEAINCTAKLGGVDRCTYQYFHPARPSRPTVSTVDRATRSTPWTSRYVACRFMPLLTATISVRLPRIWRRLSRTRR
jgi:hypothetical protein